MSNNPFYCLNPKNEKKKKQLEKNTDSNGTPVCGLREYLSCNKYPGHPNIRKLGNFGVQPAEGTAMSWNHQLKFCQLLEILQ